MRLHESDQQYVLILEFHDDVLVVDDDVDPQYAEFFQVKTRNSGHWSKRDLLKSVSMKNRKKGIDAGSQNELEQEIGSPRSILGKLLEHCRHFLPQVKTLNLVSNVTFKLPLTSAPASTDRDNFCLSELSDEILREVKDAIRNELRIEGELPWDRVYFHTSGISIKEHEKYAVGELAAFLERRRPDGRFAVQPLFRTLCGELARCATNEWKPVSFDELCQKKGIRRADLEGFLQFAENQPIPGEQLRTVKEQLTHEGATYRDVSDIEASWRRYDIDKLDQANMPVQMLKKQIVAVVNDVARSRRWRTLNEFLAEAQERFVRLHGPPDYPIDIKYLQGAILYEFKAHETRQLPQADSQPATGTP